MPRLEESIAPAKLCCDGVTAPDRQRIVVGIEKLAVKALEGIADRDHEIDGARELRVEDRWPPPGDDVEPDVGREPRNLFHQRRHQGLYREAGHHPPQAPPPPA